MNKKKLVITGSSGLIGSRVVELWKDKYELFGFDRHENKVQGLKPFSVDITDKFKVSKVLSEIQPDVVLHLAALADLETCEKDHDLAKKINVEGTRNLLESAEKTRFIYFSTGFVFSGERGDYRELDRPEPESFYAQTKLEAEILVNKLNKQAAIVRINYPYRAVFAPRVDCIRWMLPKLQQKEEITVVKDQIVKPIFIDQLVEGLEKVVKGDYDGPFHFADTTVGNWLDFAYTVCEVFGYDKGLVHGVTYEEFLAQNSRVRAPYNVSLNTEATEKELNWEPLPFSESLKIIKRQME